jgi:CRP/FNR family transcriptional regulator, nitrogen fixation regulation protein
MYENVQPHAEPLQVASDLRSLSRESVSSQQVRYRRDTEVFGEAEPAEFVYQVVEGAVRSFKLLSDGRRQIGAFHFAGDIFGLENGPVHRFTAEAIVDTTVRLLKSQDLEKVADHDLSVVFDLRCLTTQNLQHAEDHVLLLGRTTALEKVAAFLVEMDRRLAATGLMRLPMNRRDIGDYLGLRLETVSRALAELHRSGMLTFLDHGQRRITLRDRAGLAQIAITGGPE